MENPRDISTEKVYDNYEKGWNGRVEKGRLPEDQQKVTYPHPNKPGETTSQNYIEYDDLAVVVFIRKNSKGEYEFGLKETEAPAFIYDAEDERTAQGYNGMLLEASTFALPEKDKIPENMGFWLEEQILNMGLEMEGLASLDDSKTAVCQSFTNQNARFYVAGIKGEDVDAENKLHWFPLSSLTSYLDIQRMGGEDGAHSSIQTLYPLELLREKYIEQIKKIEQTEFKLDRPLPKLKLVEKQKTNPSYRFSVMEARYISSGELEKVKSTTYLTSRANAGNCILTSKDGKTIYLGNQQRSPYLTIGEEMKKEVAGGLLERKERETPEVREEDYRRAAIRELAEEAGFSTDSVRLFTGPLAATPLNDELSATYNAEYESGKEGEQQLDEQEKIGEKKPISIKKLKDNIRDSRIPLTTKYYIMLMSRDMEKTKENTKTEVGLETR